MNPEEQYRMAQKALAEGRITQEEFDYYVQRIRQQTTPQPPQAPAQQTPQLPQQPQNQPASQEQQAMSRGAHPTMKQQASALEQRRHDTLVRAMGLVGVFAFVLVLLWAFTSGGQLTGFVVLETQTPVDYVFTNNTNTTLNVTNTTTFRISGSLTDGSGRVWLHTTSGRLLVYEGRAHAARILWTDKESYARNESINVSVNATNYTLWLVDPTGGRTPFMDGDRIEAPGEYLLDALLPDARERLPLTVRNDTNTSKDTPRAPAPATSNFTDACVETCSLNTTNETLVMEVETDGTLVITSYTTTTERANAAPEQVARIEDLTLLPGETVSLDLNEYFSDPDGDTILYDFMNVPGVTMRITGSTLTITAVSGSGGSSVVYASDLEFLTQSNTFRISINGTNASGAPGMGNTANASTNGTNGTTGSAGTIVNRTNGTANGTGAITNGTSKGTTNGSKSAKAGAAQGTGGQSGLGQPGVVGLNCLDPDPNKRDPSCFVGKEERYFSESFFVENKARKPVGRFNPLGNLVLRGRLIERSTATPSKDDFSVGHLDDNFAFVPTAWIDSATGDLHLRGELHEELITLTPPPNSYTFQNRRGINLGYIDPNTGDLYLRGNLIENRRSVQ